jgi:hypothetical protein
MKKDIEATFKEKLFECRKHIEKMQDSSEYLQSILPLTEEKYNNLDKIESSFIDQFIFRFAKLQDTLGGSVFKFILVMASEEVKKMTFLDILNRLEELEIIEKSEWMKLRELRNEIAHEYSFNQEEIVDAINQIYKKRGLLIEVNQSICEFIDLKYNIKCNP